MRSAWARTGRAGPPLAVCPAEDVAEDVHRRGPQTPSAVAPAGWRMCCGRCWPQRAATDGLLKTVNLSYEACRWVVACRRLRQRARRAWLTGREGHSNSLRSSTTGIRLFVVAAGGIALRLVHGPGRRWRAGRPGRPQVSLTALLWNDYMMCMYVTLFRFRINCFIMWGWWGTADVRCTESNCAIGGTPAGIHVCQHHAKSTSCSMLR